MRLELSQGKFALIDAKDFEYLNQWKWHYCNGYATRVEYIRLSPGKRKRIAIWMHRVVSHAPDGMEVDHINRNSLDNRRSNLRICTHRQNTWNRKTPSNNTSGHKGVTWYPKYKKWLVQLSHKHLGYFENIHEAAEAYAKAAKDKFGEYA